MSHSIEKLCRRAAELGYHDIFQQLTNKDGSCVGDLLCLLEDNPGAIEALNDWIDEHLDKNKEEEEEEEEEDEVVEDDDEGEG